MDDLRQSQYWVKFVENKGWKSEKLKNGDIALIKPLVFLGSIIKIQRPKFFPTNSDITNLQKYRPLFIKIEPQIDIKGKLPTMYKFMVDTWPLIPSKTRVIDLTKPLSYVLANSTKDVRQSLKKTKVETKILKGSEVTKQDLLTFVKNYNLMAKKQKIGTKKIKEFINLKNAFGNRFYLVEGRYKGKFCAGAILLGANSNNAFYMYACTNKLGREKLGSYKVLFESIKYLKLEGYKEFDLEGVEDKRFPKETGRWGGFTIFKNKWAGKTITFDRPYIIYLSKILKFIFIFSTIGEQMLDNIAKDASNNPHVDYAKTMIRAKNYTKKP